MSDETLLTRLASWCAKCPEKRLYTFVDATGEEDDALSYRELDLKSAALAHFLLAPAREKGAGLARGERALLVYPPGLDFIVAFYACLRAGVIAVPVFPPDPSKLQKDLTMFVAIQASSGAQVALCNASYDHAKKLAGLRGFFAGPPCRGHR